MDLPSGAGLKHTPSDPELYPVTTGSEGWELGRGSLQGQLRFRGPDAVRGTVNKAGDKSERLPLLVPFKTLGTYPA